MAPRSPRTSSRLGGPNFHEIPINRPVAPLHNNQRDGLMRQTINTGQAAYHPNTIGGGCPFQAGQAMGGFVTHPQPLEGQKVRERGKKFFDHFSQATLFWNSQSPPEQQHIVQAFRFELGKLDRPAIRERMMGMLAQVDRALATHVADGLGLTVPAKPDGMLNHSVPADGDPKDFQPIRVKPALTRSAALSMAGTIKDTVKTRKVAILAADGVDEGALESLVRALTGAGAVPKIIAPRGGTLKGAGGGCVRVDWSLLTVGSVLFDAVFVPGGAKSTEALAADGAAILFVREAYKHCKAVGGGGTALAMLRSAGIEDPITAVPAFLKAIAQHRDWSRQQRAMQIAVWDGNGRPAR